MTQTACCDTLGIPNSQTVFASDQWFHLQFDISSNQVQSSHCYALMSSACPKGEPQANQRDCKIRGAKSGKFNIIAGSPRSSASQLIFP